MEWKDVLTSLPSELNFEGVKQRVEKAYEQSLCFPSKEAIYRALELTPFNAVSVVILGQDPYHGDRQADGLSFSVPMGVKIPPSLRNIFTELKNDTGITRTRSDLSDWAKQGVLLLNTTLTVKAHNANSHKDIGWSPITSHLLHILSQKRENIVFILWGKSAEQKIGLIDQEKHFIICSAHPSPLSAYRGFFGSRPFSKTNDYLLSKGKEPILW